VTKSALETCWLGGGWVERSMLRQQLAPGGLQVCRTLVWWPIRLSELYVREVCVITLSAMSVRIGHAASLNCRGHHDRGRPSA
jgi:hypothetical protein